MIRDLKLAKSTGIRGYSMRILLIAPPSLRLAGFMWPCFPLGLGYIAASLIKEGHRVEIYNADVGIAPSVEPTRYPRKLDMAYNLYEKYSAALQNPAHEAWLEVERIIRERSPDVIGISCKVFEMMSALMVARIAKSISSNIVVVLGGSAPTSCADMVLEDQNVDFAVRGEGEITMIELLRALQTPKSNLHSIDGLSLRDSSGVVHNKSRSLIEDISSLPYPARDAYLDIEKLPRWIIDVMMGDLITSRGCPYDCTYCACQAIWGSRKVRMRTVQNVVDEILYLRDTYDVRQFIFWDDNFTTRKQRIVSFCNLLLEKRADVHWVCLVRPDTIDEQRLRLMKKAGCQEILMGVESGSDRILKKVKKGLTLEQIRKAIPMIRKSRLRWQAFLMMGFPSETREEMETTMRLISELKPNGVSLSIFAPYPGTNLWQELKGKGFLKGGDWLHGDMFNLDNCYVGTMPPGEFKKLALQYLKECDQYNYRMNTPPTRYSYYTRHPLLLTKKVFTRLKDAIF